MSEQNPIKKSMTVCARRRMAALEFKRLTAAHHLSTQILLGEFDDCADEIRQRLIALVHVLPRSLFRAVLAKLYEH